MYVCIHLVRSLEGIVDHHSPTVNHSFAGLALGGQ
jgi:hypothetical protein